MTDSNTLHPLRQALAAARVAAPDGVVAFDLDSTLFDNRPRQVAILREFGRHKGLSALEAHGEHHWTSGWDMRGAMLAAGLTPAQTDSIFSEAREFWKTRFFTSAYCVHDVGLAGAADYMTAMVATGATVAYLTGRHEEMREGTVCCMRKVALPLPDGKRVHLIMKPTLEAPDDDFKRDAHQKLRTLGPLVAAFDNEPTHANDYRRNFPGALVVRLATDHSGRPVPLLAGIVEVPDFVI